MIERARVGLNSATTSEHVRERNFSKASGRQVTVRLDRFDLIGLGARSRAVLLFSTQIKSNREPRDWQHWNRAPLVSTAGKWDGHTGGSDAMPRCAASRARTRFPCLRSAPRHLNPGRNLARSSSDNGNDWRDPLTLRVGREQRRQHALAGIHTHTIDLHLNTSARAAPLTPKIVSQPASARNT